jgi:hypothetical protein
MQTSNPTSEMSLPASSSEAVPSTIYGLSEPGDLEILIPLESWEDTIRREGEYMAGQLPGERMREYFQNVNTIITRLQGSGFPIQVIEPHVRMCPCLSSARMLLTAAISVFQEKNLSCTWKQTCRSLQYIPESELTQLAGLFVEHGLRTILGLMNSPHPNASLIRDPISLIRFGRAEM